MAFTISLLVALLAQQRQPGLAFASALPEDRFDLRRVPPSSTAVADALVLCHHCFPVFRQVVLDGPDFLHGEGRHDFQDLLVIRQEESWGPRPWSTILMSDCIVSPSPELTGGNTSLYFPLSLGAGQRGLVQVRDMRSLSC
jgi:hypothetical protein